MIAPLRLPLHDPPARLDVASPDMRPVTLFNAAVSALVAGAIKKPAGWKRGRSLPGRSHEIEGEKSF